MGNTNTAVTFHGFALCDWSLDTRLIYTDGVLSAPAQGFYLVFSSVNITPCAFLSTLIQCQDTAGSEKFSFQSNKNKSEMQPEP